MKPRNGIILSTLIFLGLGVSILRPVPIPDERDCLSVKGKVTDVYEGGVKDIVFKLHGFDKEFYVNRGLERGLDLSDLRAQLINKEIVIKYPKYWTPLDPGNSVRHISKIEHEGRTIFTELD
jgi:hypothetical protein